MATIVYFMACYGLTFLLCSATILDRPRFWIVDKSNFVSKLLSCYFCAGFWVSLVLYPVVLIDQGLPDLTWKMVVKAVVHGFAGAAFTYGFDALIKAAEAVEEHG